MPLLMSKSMQASPFFDRLVFSKIKQRLGGRVRAAISGAAPLAPHVEDFMSVALCCHFSQGYGLTETCGSSFLASGNAVSLHPLIKSNTAATAAQMRQEGGAKHKTMVVRSPQD